MRPGGGGGMPSGIDAEVAAELRDLIRRNKRAIARLELANRRLEWLLSAPAEDLPPAGYIDDQVSGMRIYWRQVRYSLP